MSMKRLLWLRPDPREMRTASVMVLIAANLVPLYGVLGLHWQVFPILLVFWMENVVIGAFNVLKMLMASPASVGTWVGKLFLVPFFCIHYGMFTFVHGVFVFGLFGGYFTSGAAFPDAQAVFDAASKFQLGWAILALVLSHGISFCLNYVGKGEYKAASLNQLMGGPYGRVVLLHVTILFGGFVVMSLGSPVLALLLLVAIKTVIDIQAHLREHSRKTIDIPARDPAATTLG